MRHAFHCIWYMDSHPQCGYVARVLCTMYYILLSLRIEGDCDGGPKVMDGLPISPSQKRKRKRGALKSGGVGHELIRSDPPKAQVSSTKHESTIKNRSRKDQIQALFIFESSDHDIYR